MPVTDVTGRRASTSTSWDFTSTPGARVQLVVTDIDAGRTQLIDRGIEVSEVQTLDPRDGGKFVFFADLDGNNWAVQEIRDHVGAPLV